MVAKGYGYTWLSGYSNIGNILVVESRGSVYYYLAPACVFVFCRPCRDRTLVTASNAPTLSLRPGLLEDHIEEGWRG